MASHEPPATAVVRFALFEVDLRAGELRKSGVRVPLQDQPFRLLAYLIARPGSVATRDELRAALWPAETFVDFEQGLNAAVKRLRDALGDSADNPTFVETLPRKGYRFLAPVTDESRPVVAGAPEGSWRWHWRQPIGVVLLVLVGAAAIWSAISNGAASSLAVANRLVPNLPPSAGAASFSPDGTMIAFHTPEAGGSFAVWVTNVSAGQPVRIASEAAFPEWSPRGDRILVLHRGGIWSVPPLGGPLTAVIERGNSPSFTADGERIAFQVTGLVRVEGPLWMARADGSEGEIWMARANGTERRKVINRRSLWSSASPAISPDGRTIVYYESTDGGLVGDLWVVATDGGVPRQLTFDASAAGAPTWTPDGRFVLFHSAREGSQTLWRVAAGGGSPTPVTAGAGLDRDAAISADGRHIAYTNGRLMYSIAVLDLATGLEKVLAERPYDLGVPRFSPDGALIASFEPNRSDYVLSLVNADGRGWHQLGVVSGTRDVLPQWSSDAQWLFFTRTRPTMSFRRMRATGGSSEEVGPWTASNSPQVHPGGQQVLYVRNDALGRPAATVVRDLVTAEERQMDRILTGPRWSRRGDAVMGTDREPIEAGSNPHVFRCVPGNGSCTIVTQGQTPVSSGDGSRVLFLRAPRSQDGPGGLVLWSVAADGTGERKLTKLDAMLVRGSFDVSPKDEVVYVKFRAEPAQIWLAAMPSR